MTENTNPDPKNPEENDPSNQPSNLNLGKGNSYPQEPYSQAPSYPPQVSNPETQAMPPTGAYPHNYAQGHNTDQQAYSASDQYRNPVPQYQSTEQYNNPYANNTPQYQGAEQSNHPYANTAPYGHQSPPQQPKTSDEYSYWSLGFLAGSVLCFIMGFFTLVTFFLAPVSAGVGIYFARKAKEVQSTTMSTVAFWSNIAALACSLVVILIMGFLLVLLFMFAADSASMY